MVWPEGAKPSRRRQGPGFLVRRSQSGSPFGLSSHFELPLVPPLAVPPRIYPLYFPPVISYFASMTANWFGATYYYVFIGYSRWGPRSRVR